MLFFTRACQETKPNYLHSDQIPLMGRATRWLRGLLGGKKDSREFSKDSGFSANAGGDERKEKNRWSFKSGRDSADAAEPVQVPVMASVDNATLLRLLYSETEKEQNKHAIAVAAATAAAADAAVAAAQAAVAVVRLTSHGRGTMFGGVQERIAAVMIQTAFRGYLAKKALRALKALVKLQALVRGYLVRRHAAGTLHSMQALMRAQATVRAHKSRAHLLDDRRFMLERFDETRSEQMSSFHSRRLSGNLDGVNNGYDRSPKIVEMDTCRPKSRSSRSRTSPSLMDSAEDMNISSPLPPCQIPARISIPDCRNFQDYNWCLTSDKCRYSSTAQSTPRYMNSACIAPATPATKSVSAADGVFRRFLNLPNCPNYMTNTQSFEAKVRSHSAPKQRPEEGPRRRLPLSEVLVESRASLSGVGMQRSCTRAQEVAAFNFKTAVVDRLDRPLEFGRESERDFYLQRKW